MKSTALNTIFDGASGRVVNSPAMDFNRPIMVKNKTIKYPKNLKIPNADFKIGRTLKNV